MSRVDTSRFLVAVIISLTVACAGFEYLVRKAFEPEVASYPDFRRHEATPSAAKRDAGDHPSAAIASASAEPKG